MVESKHGMMGIWLYGGNAKGAGDWAVRNSGHTGALASQCRSRVVACTATSTRSMRFRLDFDIARVQIYNYSRIVN